MNQSAQGTDKVNAIINCHLATGRIGKPGMGPFSLTGQPNAMGGREVGGLANMLAAHMGFTPDEVDRVRRFWNAPHMAEREGLKAVQMFEARRARRDQGALGDGHQSRGVAAARRRRCARRSRSSNCSSCPRTCSATTRIERRPHVLLPAAAWGEKDGTVTNSERRISRQRAFLPLPGAVKPDWWIVSEVARQLGFGEAFAYRSSADIFREHAALSAFENGGARAFDLGGLAAISDEDYDALEPVQWPVRANGRRPVAPVRATAASARPDRKARFIAPEQPALAEQTSDEFPLRLNTGRLRDQWHTMTRTGQSPTLGAHKPEPFVEVHPLDAKRFGLANGGFARVSSRHGSCVLKVVTSAAQQQRLDLRADPLERQQRLVGAHRRSGVAADRSVLRPARGQGDAGLDRARRFRLSRLCAVARAVRVSGRNLVGAGGAARTPPASCSPATTGPRRWRTPGAELFPEAALTEFVDRKRGLYRAAAFVDGRLEGALFLGPADAPPQWGDLRQMVGGPGIAESGQVVCACFGVGVAAIAEAVASRKAASVEDIAKALRAGNKCGTCLPEIRSIVSHELAIPGCKGRDDRHATHTPADRARRGWSRWRGCRCSSRWRAAAA